ncbi:MAG: pseudouridine synthase [Syntrophobacteraceae bacterium]
MKKKVEERRVTVVRRKKKTDEAPISAPKEAAAEPPPPRITPEAVPEAIPEGVCMRLQKYFSQAGIMSRRAAEDAIQQGRVQINGRVVTTMGVQIDPARDEVRLDGELVTAAQTLHYLLFYKPKHCVTTLRDPQERKTIMDFLPPLGARVFPVGRLDYDAEGALILTNDGRLAHRLQHPRFGVPKVYEVKVKGHPSGETLDRLSTGVQLTEGVTAPAEVIVLRSLPRAAWLKITLHQGWNRQLKRMGEAVGHPVLKIKRIAYGPLTLGRMKPGDWRPLTTLERRSLERAVSESGEGHTR